MNDVGVLEHHHCVAVGVRMLHMNYADGVAIPIKIHPVGKSDDRQSDGRRGRNVPVERFHELIDAHATADVFVRYNDRSRFAKVLVAAGVIEMPVRVQYETHFPVRDLGDGGEDFLGERRVLVVDYERAVLSHRQADVAAPAHQHVHTVRHLDGSNLHIGHVLAGGQRRHSEHRGAHKHQSDRTREATTSPEAIGQADHRPLRLLAVPVTNRSGLAPQVPSRSLVGVAATMSSTLMPSFSIV